VGHPDIVQIGRLDIALTSRGLRDPLVILPLEMTRPELDGRPVANPKFCCPHHGIGEVNIDSRSYKFSAIPQQYALGIFHYIPAEDSSNPGLPKELAAYLLERTEVETHDSTLIGLSRHYRSTEDGWRRTPTGFIYLELLVYQILLCCGTLVALVWKLSTCSYPIEVLLSTSLRCYLSLPRWAHLNGNVLAVCLE
jgi:hypothetical protein